MSNCLVFFRGFFLSLWSFFRSTKVVQILLEFMASTASGSDLGISQLKLHVDGDISTSHVDETRDDDISTLSDYSLGDNTSSSNHGLYEESIRLQFGGASSTQNSDDGLTTDSSFANSGNTNGQYLSINFTLFELNFKLINLNVYFSKINLK